MWQYGLLSPWQSPALGFHLPVHIAEFSLNILAFLFGIPSGSCTFSHTIFPPEPISSPLYHLLISPVITPATQGIQNQVILRWFPSALKVQSSVQFSSITQSFDSLQPHELQHDRPPCTSPTPRVHPNSSPSSRWCHPATSSSVVPFSSCPQSLPASGSFPMSQLFAWGGQSIGVSALASVLPKIPNIFYKTWHDLFLD